MASLIYTNNRLGNVSGPSSASGSVTVTFTSKSQADSIVITLFCHACHQVISSEEVTSVGIGDVRTVSFDLGSLESSGHPGPFEFTPTGGSGEVYYDIFLSDSPPGAAKSLSGGGTYVTSVGGTITFHLSAGDNDGYVFVKWIHESGVTYSTSRNVTGNVTLYSDAELRLTAVFAKRGSLSVDAWIDADPHSPVGIATVEDEETGERSENFHKEYPEDQYEISYSFRAVRLSARFALIGRYSRTMNLDRTWPEWSYSTTEPQYARASSTPRSHQYRFRFVELNAIRLAVRFRGNGHSAHDASIDLFVAEEDDATILPIRQGPVRYSSDAEASFYARDASSVSYGVGRGSSCRVSCKLNLAGGAKFVKAVVCHTSRDGKTTYTFEYSDVREFESDLHNRTLWYMGNESNSLDIFLECGRLMYNVTGYLIYSPTSNALIYCG